MELIGKEIVVKAMDFKSMELVEKVVKLTNVLDGPGADRRDYVTVEGLQDWEVDMPLEDFIKMVVEVLDSPFGDDLGPDTRTQEQQMIDTMGAM